MARKPRTIQEQCIAKLGIHRGAIAAARVAQYAIATHELGHVPTTDEYCDYWAVDERTGWRHRAVIRDVYGDQWGEVVEAVAAPIAQLKTRSPRAVMGLRVAV